MDFEYEIWVDSVLAAEASALRCNHLAFRYKYLHLQGPLDDLNLVDVPLDASRNGSLMVPRHRYFEDASALTRDMLSDMGVTAAMVLDEMVPEISSFVLEMAEHPSFSGSRVLNFFLEVCVVDDPYDDEEEEEEIELVSRESAGEPVCTIPATRSAVEALKEMKVDASTTQGYCPICLEKLSLRRTKKAAVVVKMPCSHLFHKGCIVRWLESSHTCPLCRYAMPTSS